MLPRLAIAIILSGLVIVSTAAGAHAQQPTSYGQQPFSTTGWTFNIAPYLWMPTIQATSKLNLPPALGGTVSTDTSVGFGELLSHLNFALMVAGDARYGRFSVLTDFIYMNLGGAATHLRSVDFPGLPRIPISTAVQTHVGVNLNSKIWTLAGGYTLLQGDWGNLDAIVGFRFLGMPQTTDYSLALTIAGPRGNGATFGGDGSVSGTINLWNGIGGFRGRVRLADTGLFIPYYFDAGTGGSQLTWQIASGVGYHGSWADVSLTWRYLSFEQKSNAVVQHLSVNGPMLAATFTF